MRPLLCLLPLLGLSGLSAGKRSSEIDSASLNSSLPRKCNGASSLCDKKYSEVFMFGSHNSGFWERGGGQYGASVFSNQHIKPIEQLDLGVRFLTARTQDRDGQPHQCHGTCFLHHKGHFREYLKYIKKWLDRPENKDEVITLLIVNNDMLKASKFDAAFRDAKLQDDVFRTDVRIPITEWPTLGEFIEQGTRLIVFMDNEAHPFSVNYILPEFDYFWETKYGVTDPNFPDCGLDRPKAGRNPPHELMYIINHVLNEDTGLFGIKIPSEREAKRTNSRDSIMSHIQRCRGKWGPTANVVLLDWIETGDAIQVQDEINMISVEDEGRSKQKDLKVAKTFTG